MQLPVWVSLVWGWPAFHKLRIPCRGIVETKPRTTEPAMPADVWMGSKAGAGSFESLPLPLGSGEFVSRLRELRRDASARADTAVQALWPR
jgi:hypothetical protein